MAKFKNAIRKHYIAPFDSEHPDTPPTEDKYFGLLKVSKNLHQKTMQKMMTLLTSMVTVLKKKSSLQNLVVVHLKDTVITTIKPKTSS